MPVVTIANDRLRVEVSPEAGASVVSCLVQCRGAWEGSPVLSHLVVYTPPGQPFFAVEPVSHANNGFNLLAAGHPGTGVRVLEPGESLLATLCLRAFAALVS